MTKKYVDLDMLHHYKDSATFSHFWTKPQSIFACWRHWFISSSFQAAPDGGIPFKTHFFSEDQTSSVEVEFALVGGLWRYALELTPERILHESLRRKTSRYFSYVFEHDWHSGAYAVKQQGFSMASSEAKKVRRNASLISTAVQYGVPLAGIMVNLPIFSNVFQAGRKHLDFHRIVKATDVFREEDPLREQVVSLLQEWDFGLSDVVIEEVSVYEPG